MGHQIQHIFKRKRLVWITAVVFIVVMMSQCFEFPYDGVTSSLSYASSHQAPPSSSMASLAPMMTVDTTTKRTPSMSIDNNTFQSAASLPEETDLVLTADSSVNEVPTAINSRKRPSVDIVAIAEMSDILRHNRASVRSMKPPWSSTVDQELLDAKWQIENAHTNDDDHTLYPLYHNVSRFRRSYELMEKTLKVHIYKEGDKPIFHQPEAVTGVYASEGWFMKNIRENKYFVTSNPKKAHLLR